MECEYEWMHKWVRHAETPEIPDMVRFVEEGATTIQEDFTIKTYLKCERCGKEIK